MAEGMHSFFLLNTLKNSVPQTHQPCFNSSVATCGWWLLSSQKVLLDSSELFCSSPFRPYPGFFLHSSDFQIGQNPCRFQLLFLDWPPVLFSEYHQNEGLLFLGPSIAPLTLLLFTDANTVQVSGNCALSPCTCTLRFKEIPCHLTLLKMLALPFSFALQLLHLFYMGIQGRFRNYASNIATFHPNTQNQHSNKFLGRFVCILRLEKN